VTFIQFGKIGKSLFAIYIKVFVIIIVSMAPFKTQTIISM